MLRIGMIGAGWVTQHHLNAYKQLSERAQVVLELTDALCDRLDSHRLILLHDRHEPVWEVIQPFDLGGMRVGSQRATVAEFSFKLAAAVLEAIQLPLASAGAARRRA